MIINFLALNYLVSFFATHTYSNYVGQFFMLYDERRTEMQRQLKKAKKQSNNQNGSLTFFVEGI